MPWGPKKFMPSSEVVQDVNEIAVAREKNQWFFVGYGGRLMHAKALACWQFGILHDTVRIGSIRYAAHTPEWLKANPAAAEEIECKIPF
jgi:hypothetical protein